MSSRSEFIILPLRGILSLVYPKAGSLEEPLGLKERLGRGLYTVACESSLLSKTNT